LESWVFQLSDLSNMSAGTCQFKLSEGLSFRARQTLPPVNPLQHKVFGHARTLMQMSVGEPKDAILRSIELLGTLGASRRGRNWLSGKWR
jgi:hypothetical protein